MQAVWQTLRSTHTLSTLQTIGSDQWKELLFSDIKFSLVVIPDGRLAFHVKAIRSPGITSMAFIAKLVRNSLAAGAV